MIQQGISGSDLGEVGGEGGGGGRRRKSGEEVEWRGRGGGEREGREEQDSGTRTTCRTITGGTLSGGRPPAK